MRTHSPTKKLSGKQFDAWLYVDFPNWGEAYFSEVRGIPRRFTGSVTGARFWLARQISQARQKGLR